MLRGDVKMYEIINIKTAERFTFNSDNFALNSGKLGGEYGSFTFSWKSSVDEAYFNSIVNVLKSAVSEDAPIEFNVDVININVSQIFLDYSFENKYITIFWRNSTWK